MLYSFENRKLLNNELERVVNKTAMVAFSSRWEIQESEVRIAGMRELAVTRLYVASINHVAGKVQSAEITWRRTVSC